MLGRTVTLKLRWDDFHTITRSRTLPESVASRGLLAETAVGLVRTLLPLERRVRLLGVTVSGFGAADTTSDNQIAFDFGEG